MIFIGLTALKIEICTVFGCEKPSIYAGLRLITITLLRPKNPSLRTWIFLFKPIGLVYHHAIACISLPHLCGVYHHTIGVHISIGLMRYSGFATDDIQNFVLMICNFLEIDDVHGFAEI